MFKEKYLVWFAGVDDSTGPEVEATMDTVADESRNSGDKARRILAAIAPEQVKDPQQAYENLRTALEMLERKLPIRADDIYFEKLPGSAVGETTHKGIAVDHIMLMHPAARLAHVIAHEWAHAGGHIQNEGLVEQYIRVLGFADDGLNVTDKYTKALEDFNEFVARVSPTGAADPQTVEKVYELYYGNRFNDLYELYEENYWSVKGTAKERDEAEAFFWQVFPELDYSDTGETEPKKREALYPDYANEEKEG